MGKRDVPQNVQECWGQLLDIRKVGAEMERDAKVRMSMLGLQLSAVGTVV